MESPFRVGSSHHLTVFQIFIIRYFYIVFNIYCTWYNYMHTTYISCFYKSLLQYISIIYRHDLLFGIGSDIGLDKLLHVVPAPYYHGHPLVHHHRHDVHHPLPPRRVQSPRLLQDINHWHVIKKLYVVPCFR